MGGICIFYIIKNIFFNVKFRRNINIVEVDEE